MSSYAVHGRRRVPGPAVSRLVAPLLIAAAAAVAAVPIAYVLWPRWPDPVALDAPALPISVGGVLFNIPPAAIRVPVQRRPGVQPRVDLAFLWPSLTPPDPAARPTAAAPKLAERIFVTVAASDGTLSPPERLKTIYPRYVEPELVQTPDGLITRAFRIDTPYRGEDLIYEARAPERFLLRCTRTEAVTVGMCLHERRLAGADITVRFPRDWLLRWPVVADGIDRLIASLQQHSNG